MIKCLLINFKYQVSKTFFDYKDPDGLYWCSTRVNRKSRNHIGGKGHWGYCKPGCEIRPDFNTTVLF